MRRPLSRLPDRPGAALRPFLAALAIVLAVVGSGVAGAAADAPGRVVVTIRGLPSGSRPIPAGFVGVSMEYDSVLAYEGTGAAPANPVLAQLIRNLAPGQTPVVRIGGDSTDWSWWPVPGIPRPPGVTTDLSPSWTIRAKALAQSSGARLILGINLEADNPTIAAVEARQLLAGIGRQHVEALEIGNEPQLYPIRGWFRSAAGRQVPGRPPNYDLADYAAEFKRFAKVLPRVPLAGPSVGRSWISQLGPFITGTPAARIVTFHAYGDNSSGRAFRGRNCSTPPSDPSHPTVATLIAPYASLDVMRGVAPLIALAHAHGQSFRLDEVAPITCAGEPGVSDTFTSALWALNALFAIASGGADGVNLHTWNGSAGRLFDFDQAQGQWSGSVQPEYYGLLAFAQAVPPRSRILPTRQANAGLVQSWAVLAPDRSIRLVLINDSLTLARSVFVPAPGRRRPGELERLQAPSASATSGVTLGGQSFGPQTTTGVLAGPPANQVAVPSHGGYTVTLPAASAAVLTIPGSRS